jgi:hypothetical protein
MCHDATKGEMTAECPVALLNLVMDGTASGVRGGLSYLQIIVCRIFASRTPVTRIIRTSLVRTETFLTADMVFNKVRQSVECDRSHT